MSQQLPNPFAVPVQTPVPETHVPEAHEPEAQLRWGIEASAPPVDPSEVESTESAVEVVVMWGDSDVLHVEHVSPPRDVTLGDLSLADDTLGRLPIVVERAGTLCCVLPEGAEGTVTVGEATRSFDTLAAEGKLTPYDAIPGARLFVMPDGAAARVTHEGFTFLVRPTQAGKLLASGGAIPWKRYGWIAASLGVHAFVLTMFYFMPPSTQALSFDNADALGRMVEYMDPGREVIEETPDFLQPEEPSNEQAGGEGERAAEDEGAMGREDSPNTNNRYAVEGRPDDPNPEMARENVREHMAEMTAIGTVAALVGSWDAPTSPYGADRAHGLDAFNAMGSLMGAQAGNDFGFGGLGMGGTGRGGGGNGLGTIGLGRLGTMGHGDGTGPGNGYGDGIDLPGRERTPRVPTINTVDTRVVGALSAEAIRRVVRRHLPEVRHCYEQGLVGNPSLEGRVTVSWIVSPTGAVQSANVVNSSLSNGRVESCVEQAVRRWTFPQPEGGGTVGVNYPFVLQTH